MSVNKLSFTQSLSLVFYSVFIREIKKKTRFFENSVSRLTFEMGGSKKRSRDSEDAEGGSEDNEPMNDSPSTSNVDESKAEGNSETEIKEKEDEPTEAKKTKLEEPSSPPAKKKRSPDIAKFWKAVEDDPTDFTGWTYLLQFVDTTGAIEDGREAYDAFLHRYPYCYGYWKKYADLEKRKGTPEKCMSVFERGISAIPLSADLWIHYLNHVKSEFGSKPEFVRTQYERAIEGCGRDWRSDKLWDHFVKWETQIEKDKEVGTKNFHRVLALYDRILDNPTQGLAHQFDMFKDFVKEHEPKDIMEVNSFLSLRKEALKSAKKSDDDTESKDAPGEENDEAPVASEEEIMAMREKIIFARKKAYKETEEKVQLRWKYEDAIKRPYFHVKPLERGQLKNWSEYLEFEENQSKKVEKRDLSQVTILYERCMIACALYEEFWMKYVHWLLRSDVEDAEEKVRRVYTRACINHLPDKVDIHLNWAAFEEQRGRVDESKRILEGLEKKHPELMSVVLRLINLQRRCGNHDQVHSLYKSCIDKAASSNAKAELSVKYSRFLRLVVGDDEAARSVLQAVLDKKDEKNAKIFMQLLDIELHAKPMVADNVLKIFDTAIGTKGMPSRQKLLFSQRKVEFLEDFGTSIVQVNEAKEAHEKLVEECKKEAKASESTSEKAIETIEGHSGGGGSKSKLKNGGDSSTTYAPSSNSASYAAAHASSYDQYGSRYNYGNYGQYYQQGYYQSY